MKFLRVSLRNFRGDSPRKKHYRDFSVENKLPRFAAKNKTEMTLFKIILRVFFYKHNLFSFSSFIFFFLYRDELACSHLDGIFVK